MYTKAESVDRETMKFSDEPHRTSRHRDYPIVEESFIEKNYRETFENYEKYLTRNKWTNAHSEISYSVNLKEQTSRNEDDDNSDRRTNDNRLKNEGSKKKLYANENSDFRTKDFIVPELVTTTTFEPQTTEIIYTPTTTTFNTGKEHEQPSTGFFFNSKKQENLVPKKSESMSTTIPTFPWINNEKVQNDNDNNPTTANPQSNDNNITDIKFDTSNHRQQVDDEDDKTKTKSNHFNNQTVKPKIHKNHRRETLNDHRQRSIEDYEEENYYEDEEVDYEEEEGKEEEKHYEEDEKKYEEDEKQYEEDEKQYEEDEKQYEEDEKGFDEDKENDEQKERDEEEKRLEKEEERRVKEEEKRFEEEEKRFEEEEKRFDEEEKRYDEEEKRYDEEEKRYDAQEENRKFKETEMQNYQQTEDVDKKTEVDDRNKFSYIVDEDNYRKYRVEERTINGFIVGEYGVVKRDDGSLRGVRYTADGSANPQLIHDALMKFLSL